MNLSYIEYTAHPSMSEIWEYANIPRSDGRWVTVFHSIDGTARYYLMLYTEPWTAPVQTQPFRSYKGVVEPLLAQALLYDLLNNLEVPDDVE